MTAGHRQSEKYRRKVKRLHAVDAFVLSMAAAAVALTVVSVVQGRFFLLPVIIVTGSVMNIGIAARAFLMKFWPGFIAALVLACALLAGMVYFSL